ncbi:MAG: hypothetical protein ACRD1R_13030 [Acidobacteriota bacterium]
MKPWQGRVLATIVLAATVGGCGVQKADQADVQRFFSTHKVGSSPDYAVMKNGTDHLTTIHGYMDDLATCMQLIEPYNKDSSLSTLPGTYSCVPLNH